MSHDLRGRMLDDGERVYRWNDVDQLIEVKVKGGGASSSLFDHQGMRRVRVERDAVGERKTYFVDDWAEFHDGKLHRFIVHGGQRVARRAEANGQVAGGIGASPLGDGDEPPAATSGCSAARTPPPSPRRAPSSVGDPRTILGAVLAVVLVIYYRRRLARAARWVGPVVVIAMASALGSAACGGDAPAPPRVYEGSVETLSDADDLLLSDAIGSLTETVSGGGSPKTLSAVIPFGIERFDSAADLSRMFANTPRDKAVGLDQMGARAYAPSLGVWTSVDPLVVDSPEALIGSQPGANAYAYADGNPVRLVDRNGHAAQMVLFNPAAFVFVAVAVVIVATAPHVKVSSPGPTMTEGQLWAASQPKPTFQPTTAPGVAPKPQTDAPPDVRVRRGGPLRPRLAVRVRGQHSGSQSVRTARTRSSSQTS